MANASKLIYGKWEEIFKNFNVDCTVSNDHNEYEIDWKRWIFKGYYYHWKTGKRILSRVGFFSKLTNHDKWLTQTSMSTGVFTFMPKEEEKLFSEAYCQHMAEKILIEGEDCE